MNGKFESSANCAAKAVLPLFGGPSRRIDTKPKYKRKTKVFFKKYVNYFFVCVVNLPELSGARACCVYNNPSSRKDETGVPQLIIPRDR